MRRAPALAIIVAALAATHLLDPSPTTAAPQGTSPPPHEMKGHGTGSGASTGTASHGATPNLPFEFARAGRTNQRLLNPVDGSILSGGHLSPQTAGCPAGVQAFYTKEDAQGALVCQHFGHAGAGCAGTGANGVPLFDGVTSVPPAFIVSSTQTDLVIDPDSGGTYTAYSVLLAWRDGAGDLQATWGALVLRHGLHCGLLGDFYWGVVPTGMPLNQSTEPTIVTCDTLCAALAVEHEQFSVQSVAFDHDTVAAAGWYRAPVTDPGALAHKDVFVSRLTPDLSSAYWTAIQASPGDDVARDVAISNESDVFVTGYFGENRDFFVAHYTPAGDLHQATIATGPLDTEGHALTLEGTSGANPNILVQGTFTDSATFSGQHVSGTGTTSFTARYRYDLRLVDLEIDEDSDEPPGDDGPVCADIRRPDQRPASWPALPSRPLSATQTSSPRNGIPGVLDGLPVDDPPSTKDNNPTGIQVVTGNPGSGACAQDLLEQISHSDDQHLHLFATPTQDDSDTIVARYTFQLTPDAPALRRVKVEFNTEYCAQLIIRLRGGASDATHALPTVALCPLDDQVVVATIPQHVIDDLGYTASSVELLPPLEVEVQLNLLGDAPCPGTDALCGSAGKDGDFDEVEVETDY